MKMGTEVSKDTVFSVITGLNIFEYRKQYTITITNDDYSREVIFKGRPILPITYSIDYYNNSIIFTVIISDGKNNIKLASTLENGNVSILQNDEGVFSSIFIK